jgi:hypothetical protein
MSAPYRHALRRPRSVARACAAWVLTGPLGHFYAGVMDWAGVLVRYVRARGRWEDM